MKLFGKIFAIVFVSFVAVVLLIFYAFSTRQIKQATHGVIARNQAVVQVIAREIEVGYSDSMWPFTSLEELSKSPGVIFWWVVRNDGMIYLADQASFMGTRAADYFPQLKTPMDQEEFLIRPGAGVLVRPLSMGVQKGSFWLGFSLQEISLLKQQVLLFNLTLFLAAVMVLGLVLLMTMRYLAKPINNLVAAAGALGQGDLSHRADITSEDELGQLARAFNSMADKIQEREARIRAILETAANIAYIISDLTGSEPRILEFSPGAEHIFGYRDAEVVGQPVARLHSSEAAAGFYGLIEAMRQGKTGVTRESVVIRKSGEKFPAIVTSYPVLDAQQQLTAAFSVYLDITERHRVDKALKESEERFRAIFETARDSIFIKDRSLRYIQVNPNMARLFDLPATEIIGKTDEELYGAAAAADIIEVDRRTLAGEVVEEVHTKPVLGVPVTFHVIKVPLYDAAGAIFGLCGIARDITDLQQAEKALREGETTLRTLIEANPESLFLLDRRGVVLAASQVAAQRLGNNLEEIMGTDAFAPIPYEVATIRREIFQEVVATGQPRRFEDVRGDFHFDVSMIPIFDQDEVAQVAILAVDISHLKKAQEALRQSEARFRLFFEYAPDAYYLIDLQGNFLDVNRVTEELTGYGREELIGRNYQAFSLFEDRENALVAGLLQQSVNGGILGPVELCLNRKAGDHVMIEAKGLPLQMQGETLLLGVARDITAQKQAAEALRERETTLRTLIEANPEPLVLMDTRGMVMAANTAAAQGIGRRLEELIGADLHAMFPPEVAKRRLEIFQRVVDSGQPMCFEDVCENIYHVNYLTPIFADDQVVQIAVLSVDISAQKQAAEALRVSEARYRMLFEAFPEAISLMDIDMNVIMENPCGLRLFGSDGLAAGTSSMEFVAPEDRLRAQVMFTDLLETGETQSCEITMRNQDGSRFPCMASLALIPDVAGRPQGIIGIARDITALKQAEAGLRQSEQRFRDITEYAAEWVWEVDAQGRFTYSSPVVEQLLGYTPEEVLGKYFYDFFPPDPRDKLKSGALEAFAAGQPLRDFLKPNLHKNGQMVWLSTNAMPLLDEQGDLRGYRGLDIDITERREAEDLSRNLIAKSPVGVYLVQKGKFQLVNQWFYAISGYREEDLPDLPPLELIHREDRQATRRNAVKMLKGLSAAPYEYRTITKAGDTRWIMETVASIQYRGKRATLGFFMDITERKHLENQLLQAQKMEAVGRLAGGVAHDFNNLLMAIMGYGELMRSQIHPGDPLYGHLENILKAGERAGSLTQQLLTFSRRQIVAPQVLDLRRVVIDLEPMLRRLIGEDLDLEIIMAPQSLQVKADSGHLGQILMNLVLNARDAMPRGGRLTLTTAAVDLTMGCHSRFGLTPPGAYAMLRVQDTGVGMDAVTQAHIFEPFFTTKAPGKGSGLGLSIVYGIVKQSGGYLDVVSEPGAGSTFTIYLPRLEAIEEPPKAKILLTASFRGEETILLVEDEDVLRTLLAKFLRLHGYTVLEARHGGEALLICERHPGTIHLMVTDVVMPQMSGRELHDRLSPLRPEMLVLYMSGYTEDALVQHGVADLSAVFLQKPFRPIELAQRVHAVLHSASGR